MLILRIMQRRCLRFPNSSQVTSDPPRRDE
jgi:hypothetical protein